jgi:hypothetical protein
MKPFIKITLAFVIIIAVSGILAALILYNKKHPDVAKVKPDYIISSSLLQKAFEDNETTASSIYINKIIEVSGKIASVKPGENNILSITLVTGNDLSSVICTFPSNTDTSKFSAGEEITLRGECSGFLMDVLLNNCAVINPE